MLWLFSVLLVKIVPVWYQTLTLVTNNEVVNNLNEIMVRVRLKDHLVNWKILLSDSCNSLVKLRKDRMIDNAFFAQDRIRLLRQHTQLLSAVYNRAHYEARQELLRSSFKIKGGNSLFHKAKGLYHWRELNKIRRSQEQLYPFVGVIRYTGSIALSVNTSLDKIEPTHEDYDACLSDWLAYAGGFSKVESLVNTGDLLTANSLANKGSLDIPNIYNIFGPNLIDLGAQVYIMMLEIPGVF